MKIYKSSELDQIFTIYAPPTNYYYVSSSQVHPPLIYSNFVTDKIDVFYENIIILVE
jgi:hypothetical protein